MNFLHSVFDSEMQVEMSSDDERNKIDDLIKSYEPKAKR